MDRRVTPPKRVTSPTRGPPPPCKQALKPSNELILTPLHNINRQNVMANKFILGRLGENQPYKLFM